MFSKKGRIDQELKDESDSQSHSQEHEKTKSSSHGSGKYGKFVALFYFMCI